MIINKKDTGQGTKKTADRKGQTSVRSHLYRNAITVFTCAVVIMMALVGCGPSTEELEAVKYTP